jgi:selenoprotein W-related protein
MAAGDAMPRFEERRELRCRPDLTASQAQPESSMTATPAVEIAYCRLCGWGLRAAWMAQELLATFAEEIGSVILAPDATGGVFEVRVDGETIWSRKDKGRFPEITELKQLVRDRIAPGRSLGHSDRVRDSR